MTLNVHANVDPPIDRLTLAHLVGSEALMELIDNLVTVN